MENLIHNYRKSGLFLLNLIVSMSKIVFISVFITVSSLVFSQENEKFSAKNFDMRFGWTTNMNFNLNDFYMGMAMGVEEQTYKWAARFSFDFRPYHKKIQIKENSSTVNQYFEQKYFLSLDLEKRFGELSLPKSGINFFIGLKSGWLFGNYRGIEKSPDNFFALSPSLGVCFVKKIALFKVGYCYLNTHSVDIAPNRIVLSMTIFGEGNKIE